MLRWVVFCLLLSATALAQEPLPAERVTLKDVLARAERDAYGVLLAKATLDRFDALEDQAIAAYFPKLLAQAQAGLAYDNRLVLPNAPRIDSKSFNAQGSLNLDWTLIDFARDASHGAARARTRAARHARKSAIRQALLAAVELFFRASAATALVEDAALTVERRTSQHAAASDLVKAGTRSPLDAQRARIEMISAEYTLKARRSDQQAAFSALAVAMGLSPTRLVQPAPSENTFAGAVSARRAEQLAYQNRPEVQQLRAVVLSRRKEHSTAIGQRLPTVGVSATGSLSYVSVIDGEGIDGSQYGGNAIAYLRWSLLDPVIWTQGGVTEAGVLEAQRQLKLVAQSVMAEAVEAAFLLQRAKTELDRAEAVLAAGRVTREAQNGRYRAGLASLLELLDAENLEQVARQQRILAERDYRIASARLWAACGLLKRWAR
ncbi:MAG TPA: TolC family protein [Polyangiaceae bacterium]